MANTSIAYQELRFNVRDPQITHVHCLVENLSRDGFPVGGWYHKAFPARMPISEIMDAMFKGNDDPILWDKGLPE